MRGYLITFSVIFLCACAERSIQVDLKTAGTDSSSSSNTNLPPNNNQPPPADTTTTCKITQAICPLHPEYVGTFADNYNNSSSVQSACMQRANDFYTFCGGAYLMNGQSTKAEYYIGINVIESRTINLKVPTLNYVYRFYNGEHFYSLSADEGTNAGYIYEGVGFKTFSSNANLSDVTALYRCIAGGHHFVSTDPNCEGQANEGSYGYIFTKKIGNSIPLYRFYGPGDHLITTNAGEAGGVYTPEGILGFVVP